MRKVFVASAAVVVYTFVSYPAAVALAARLRPRPVRSDPAYRPTLSLVIAAYNEADVIERKLENVRALAYPRESLEVVVAADGSDDATPQIAARFERVRVLHAPLRRGKMAALNRAVAATSGDVLVFSDANNFLPATSLEALAAPFADPAVGVVTGRKAISGGNGRALDDAEGAYWRYESKIKGWESGFGSAIGVSGEVLAVRRSAFRPPPDDALVEDFALALAAAADGWRVVYAPDAVSLEPASATVEDEAIRRARIVAGVYQTLSRQLPGLLVQNPRLAFQVVSHKGLRPLIPYALTSAALATVAAARRDRWARPLLALQAAFYFAALLGWRFQASARRTRVLFFPYYFCTMNGVAVRGLVRFLAGRETVTWKKVGRG